MKKYLGILRALCFDLLIEVLNKLGFFGGCRKCLGLEGFRIWGFGLAYFRV